ncbi:MAG TPA: hypothetical protein VKZ58_05535 [Longimicrobiales bacterium]|nr:hypothetical protein [Longimicrobiales bacterium]
MARHNREGQGSDQRGYGYKISYQPDWLRMIKVTRTLDSGRQSTKTLFRNPSRREQDPGSRVRTRVTSAAQGLDFEITVHDPRGVVKRIVVETKLGGRKAEQGDEEVVIFTIDDENPPPDNGDGDEDGDEGDES